MVGASGTPRAGFASALLGAAPRPTATSGGCASARWPRWTAGRRRRRRPAARAACRTACRSGSRWPARWSPSRGCCCSTSRPAACPRTRWHELGQLIRELRGRRRSLLVEHHMDLVMSVCDGSSCSTSASVIADRHAGRGPGRPEGRRGLPGRRGRREPTRPSADAECRRLRARVEDVVTAYGAVRGAGRRSSSTGRRRRRITAVLGANGAGKTTLLRTVTGWSGRARAASLSTAATSRARPVEDDRAARASRTCPRAAA